ncbi:hypothetical protein ACLOJK_005077 [Asimina triloba]
MPWDFIFHSLPCSSRALRATGHPSATLTHHTPTVNRQASPAAPLRPPLIPPKTLARSAAGWPSPPPRRISGNFQWLLPQQTPQTKDVFHIFLVFVILWRFTCLPCKPQLFHNCGCRTFAFVSHDKPYMILSMPTELLTSMAHQGGSIKSTAINGVKMYSVSGQRSTPTWLPPKKLKALKKDKGYMQRVDLIQDLRFEIATTRIKATPDGEFIIASGIYPPQVKVYELRELSLKFERHLVSDVINFQVLSDDYSKIAFLCADRSGREEEKLALKAELCRILLGSKQSSSLNCFGIGSA